MGILRTPWIAAFLAVSALSATACGGDGGDGSTGRGGTGNMDTRGAPDEVSARETENLICTSARVGVGADRASDVVGPRLLAISAREIQLALQVGPFFEIDDAIRRDANEVARQPTIDVQDPAAVEALAQSFARLAESCMKAGRL